jgi:type VI secretion system protein ImpF
MVQLAERERLQPSLLDRLTDNAPTSKRDTPDQQTLSTHALKQAVLRDLAWLLNTTNLGTTETLMDGASRAASSTINFGIPGFTGMVVSRGRMPGLENSIAAAIRTFEPRINPDSLRVRVREQKQDNPIPALVFEIEGELWAQPVPQALFLETAIELETRLAIVTDAQGRA